MPDDLSLPLAQAAPGGAHVGGLVGYTCGSKLDYTNNFGSVSNSYARGSVSGTSDVGGLVGYNSNYGSLISKSYSTGHLSGQTFVGGLVGYNFSKSTVSGSFWDTTTSGLSTSAGGRGMTNAEMQNEKNFTSATAANGNVDPGWDFVHIWYMDDGKTYPLLDP